MKIECTPKEAADKNVFVFPTKGYDEILFFQSKQEMLKSAAAHPNVVIPILGGGNDTELDDMFQNVYCALRKHVDGVEDVSGLGEILERSALNLKDFTTEELVAELMTREGIETTIAEPYEDVVVAANGPAIILKVID